MLYCIFGRIFFNFVCYKILVSDLSLSGCLAVDWFFGIFQSQPLATELLMNQKTCTAIITFYLLCFHGNLDY